MTSSCLDEDGSIGRLFVFSGGSAFNFYAEALVHANPNVTFCLPVSDNGTISTSFLSSNDRRFNSRDHARDWRACHRGHPFSPIEAFEAQRVANAATTPSS